MLKQKKAQGIIELISGITVIIGGVLVLFNFVNAGSLVVTVGLLFELIKIVIEKGF